MKISQGGRQTKSTIDFEIKNGKNLTKISDDLQNGADSNSFNLFDVATRRIEVGKDWKDH